ncbi:hypothetical protein [Haloferax larsenii]|uniref:Uncharacterized protein n=1 Tax=Haloferax larsenii TaxID=302484 RepID=A0A1H7T6P1_HALLR|nr:hypothetical protein [Haloferax larsenii]SEL80531.1 hypothetical protein SAMN04488691_10896 [Haloferax larsenii]
MEEWLRLASKIHTYHYVVLGVAGMGATVGYANPGMHVLHIGPLRVDVFYLSLALFGLLFILSATDSYDPEDYGLSASDSEK